MMTFFDSWMRMIDVGLGMTRASVRAGEMLIASASVIGHRSGIIGAAMHDPVGADHGELNRMVAEKVEAFAKAGSSLMSDWITLQSDLVTQTAAMMTAFATGRPPTAKAMTQVMNRSISIAGKMVASGDRAVKPIHAKARANSKRLAAPRS